MNAGIIGWLTQGVNLFSGNQHAEIRTVISIDLDYSSGFSAAINGDAALTAERNVIMLFIGSVYPSDSFGWNRHPGYRSARIRRFIPAAKSLFGECQIAKRHLPECLFLGSLFKIHHSFL